MEWGSGSLFSTTSTYAKWRCQAVSRWNFVRRSNVRDVRDLKRILCVPPTRVSRKHHFIKACRKSAVANTKGALLFSFLYPRVSKSLVWMERTTFQNWRDVWCTMPFDPRETRSAESGWRTAPPKQLVISPFRNVCRKHRKARIRPPTILRDNFHVAQWGSWVNVQTR